MPRGVCAWLCGTMLLGCPEGSATDSSAKPTPSQGAESNEFRAKAHEEAYARLLPLARKALELADPVSDAALMGTAVKPRPFTVGGRAALRKAVEAAWIEAADIRGELLPPEDALLLRAARFALARLRDEHQRRPASRTDPGAGVRAVVAVLDEVAFRGPGCADCDEALAASGPELDAAITDLGATTPVRARAAAEDCAALRDRLGAWRRAHPDPHGLTGAEALDAALERSHGRLIAIASALEPRAASNPDRDGIRIARASADVLRISDRLGAVELRRWLEVHEAESRDAKTLFGELVPAALQLAALAGSVAVPAADTVREVDAERCARAWSALVTYAKTQPALVAQLDCERDRVRIAAAVGERADDDALALALVRTGIVEPTRRATRARTEPMLARVTGDIAPVAHRHSLALAILSGTKQKAARSRAAAAAQGDVCKAMVGLWIHGELGDDAMLHETLAKPCSGIDTRALVDAVVARPHVAFGGLGLALLAMGPADAAALERSWWLPIGLVIAAARPETTRPETPVAARTEEIGPGAPQAEAGAPP